MGGLDRAMGGDAAQWIRRRKKQALVDIFGGSRERSRRSIGALMQSDVMAANRMENIDMNGIPLASCLLDQFVPECTEVML
jgi:hypothetical protein